MTAAVDKYQAGYCGTYALALTVVRPGLRFGVVGRTDDEGWEPCHFFAHDDDFAYDSLGRFPLPYHGANGQFDVSLTDQDPAAWGIPDDEDGDRGLHEAVATIRGAA